MLVPHVSGHVIGLAEGQTAERAAKRSLLGVRPHMSGEPVCSSEVPGADLTAAFLYFGGRRFGAVVFMALATFRVINRRNRNAFRLRFQRTR